MAGYSSARARRLLEGAIDLHVHTGPSLRRRTGDAWDLAEVGARAGMRGALVKDHDRATFAESHLVNKRMNASFELFGSVCLNAPAGGLNPAAVETAARLGARAIFLPTNDAANDAAFWAEHLGDRDRTDVVRERPRTWTRRLSVIDQAGELTADARAVVDACAAEEIAICTGHLAAAEISAVVAAAGPIGARVLVTHAPVWTSATTDQLRAWAAAGALLELVYIFCCDATGLPSTLRRSVEVEAKIIDTIGAENIVLSTDLGQEGNPPPVEGFSAFLSGLMAEGISEADITAMTRVNPARALGIDE